MILENDGFVVSGKEPHECEEKDSYSHKTLEKNRSTRIDLETSKQSTADFFHEQLGGLPRLTNVHIEITSKCNERCIHCYIPNDSKLKEMDSHLFYNLLDQCKSMHAIHLTISGGEPMLHKGFCEFLKRIREMDFAVSILSNLTVLSDEIVWELKQNSILGVQTSLYSMDPDVHDGITKIRGSHQKTKDGILRLIDNDIPLQISCPIIKQNKDSYREVASWALKRNVRVNADHVIIGQYDHNAANLGCRLSIEELEQIIRVNSAETHLPQIKDPADDKKQIDPDENVCSVCTSSICIAENGNVYPCAGWQGYVVGNVKENTLREIWLHSEKVQYLRQLRKRNFPKCLRCADSDYCTMCMVRNSNEDPHGSPLAVSDYFCKIANLSKRLAMKK